MRKFWLFSLAFLVLTSFVALAGAQQADVSGEWTLTVQSPRGEMTSTVKFVQDGEKLTVTMIGPRGGETSGEGTIKDKNIQWSVIRTRPDGNQMTFTYKGTVEGTSMSGTVDIGGQATADWKATKK